MQRERTPFAQTAGHRQSSAHGLRRFLRQAQTQSGAMRLRSPRGISPVERFEDVGDLAGLNSLPSVLDGDQNLSRLRSRPGLGANAPSIVLPRHTSRRWS